MGWGGALSIGLWTAFLVGMAAIVLDVSLRSILRNRGQPGHATLYLPTVALGLTSSLSVWFDLENLFDALITLELTVFGLALVAATVAIVLATWRRLR